jgi:hypothetical protein
VKAVLWFGLHQTLFGEAGQALAYDAGAAVVAVGQFGEPQLGSWQHATRQDVGAELRVHLFRTRDRRQGRPVARRLRLSSRCGRIVGDFPHGRTVKHFREWYAISKFS